MIWCFSRRTVLSQRLLSRLSVLSRSGGGWITKSEFLGKAHAQLLPDAVIVPILQFQEYSLMWIDLIVTIQAISTCENRSNKLPAGVETNVTPAGHEVFRSEKTRSSKEFLKLGKS